MDSNWIPSPKHTALVSIATKLWSSEDIRVLSETHFSAINNDKEVCQSWSKITDKVLEKVAKLPLTDQFQREKLPLTDQLKREISNAIYAIGLQILAWIEFHNRSSGFSIDTVPDEFSWTPQGTIDVEKTVEKLVSDQGIDIATRYRLACTCCLEAHVYRLWQQLGTEEFHGKDLKRIREEESALLLVVFWSYYVEGKIDEFKDEFKSCCCIRSDSAYEYALRLALEKGNEAAARYFLQKLTTEEKDNIVVQAAANVALRGADFFNRVEQCAFTLEGRHCDVLCFLLSTMSSQQQEKVFELRPRHVLECLLEWPWQDRLVQTAKRMWAWLPLKDYNLLLLKMMKKAGSWYQDYDYKKLFETLWLESPFYYREYVGHVCTCDGELLSELLETGDEENIVLVLCTLTEEDRETFMFDKGISHCKSLIDQDEWNLLKFFVRKCLSSIEAIMKFKKLFEQVFQPSTSNEEMKHKKDFIKFLNAFILEKICCEG